MLQALQQLIQFSYCEWELPLPNPHLQPLSYHPSSDLTSLSPHLQLPPISPYHLITIGQPPDTVNLENQQYNIEQVYEMKMGENEQKSIKILKILKGSNKPIEDFLGIRTSIRRDKIEIENIDSFKERSSACFYLNSQIGSPIVQLFDGRIYLIGFRSNPNILFNQQIIQFIHSSCLLPSGVLKLDHQNIGQEGIQIIVSKRWHNLTQLKLWWNGIGDDGIEGLMKNEFPSLCVLDVRKNGIGERGVKCICDREWRRLRTIYLGNNVIGERGVKLLSESRVGERLQTLDIQTNKISTRGIENMKKGKWPSLTFLNFNFNHLSFPQIQLLKLCSLTQLHLSNNQIQSIELIHSSLFPNLKFCSLYNNLIVHTQAMKKVSLRSLKELWIEGNPILQVGSWWESSLRGMKLIRYEFGSENRLIGNDLRFMLKMQTKQLKKINIESKKRIREKSILNCLDRKYDKIDIRLHH